MQDTFINSTGNRKFSIFLSRVVTLCVLTLVYYLVGKLGLSLAFVNPSTTAVWPSTGIALVAFLLIGNHAAIGILLGAFLVNFTTSGLVLSSITIAIGNTLEGFVGAYLVQRFAHGAQAFNKTADVFKFTLLAAMLSTTVSATIGVISLAANRLASPTDYAAIWLTWWLGDAAGNLIVAPVLILWATHPKIYWKASQGVEAGIMLLSLFLIVLALFSNQSTFAVKNYPLGFLFIPIVIWAAYRFGSRDVATLTLVLSAIAIVGTLQGVGPFVQAAPNESLLVLQSFMMMTAITGLGLAASVSERREAEAELKNVNQKLKLNLTEMEEHNRKIVLLNEMGDLLQSCSTLEEAYTIIGQLGKQLLPEETGVLYITRNSQNRLEAMATWGISFPESDAFSLDDCWALRRGRTHVLNTDPNSLELICPHLQDHPPAFALCIPMMAQGDAMGILHIRIEAQPGQAQPTLTESKQQIARAMADSMALAMANLKLRIYLREQSIRDSLTGLFNRRYLDETLEREFKRAARMQRTVGIIMLDLDHFKGFNDTFGHEAGDILLQKLGEFLKQHLRGGDIACRYGGEEFVLILPEVSLEHVQRRAEQIREEVKNLNIQYNDTALTAPTLSLGIAMFPEHGETSQQVLSAADTALYTAKGNGRDRVVIAPLQRNREITSVEPWE
jgi:diguanylate cyclase (GGDEF)-like protein